MRSRVCFLKFLRVQSWLFASDSFNYNNLNFSLTGLRLFDSVIVPQTVPYCFLHAHVHRKHMFLHKQDPSCYLSVPSQTSNTNNYVPVQKDASVALIRPWKWIITALIREAELMFLAPDGSLGFENTHDLIRDIHEAGIFGVTGSHYLGKAQRNADCTCYQLMTRSWWKADLFYD